MYYLIKSTKEDDFKIIEIEDTTDATYNQLRKENYKMRGQFGLLEYAEIWRDYNNGKLSRAQLNLKLR